ncbi:MAG: alanine--tRNA ligase [Eubacteriales bacterium]|nr:alanine--tRNA ligase [Eubacteriales bacterium]MDD4133734.1 alanine--tRNA ligase [Eubacteriales bacterium]
MKDISAANLRSMFIEFFVNKGHTVIPSASLVPENDPTVLFTTAGMHPLVPYLMGQPHPAGKRLVNVQKCVRTGDIDDVGDTSHLTFFEMLGNWSLGDYFKNEMIPWSWEFLTSPQYLALDKDKLAFSVFEGDENAPRDQESFDLWVKAGARPEQIFFLPKENNWWGPAGQTGPCGPDTEMFIVRDQEPCGPNCSPACGCGRYLEIWNDVFMQYEKLADGSFVPLKHQNVDTGMGLERTVSVLAEKATVYETDLFSDIIAKIEELSGKAYEGADEENLRAFRIIADHLRTATFILGDTRGVTPSNVDQGYVLRRLIRRAVRHGMSLEMPEGFTADVAMVIISQYQSVYPELRDNRSFVLEQLLLEEKRFARTLRQGVREFEKMLSRMEDSIGKMDAFRTELRENLFRDADLKRLSQAEDAMRNIGSALKPTPEAQTLFREISEVFQAVDTIKAFKDKMDARLKGFKTISGRDAFKLYDTYGFPVEITMEMARERGLKVDEQGFEERFRQHQKTSQAGAEQRFKGGLADSGEQTARLHTATHLLQAALRRVLGPEVAQKGSNITAERLRFDFTFGRRMTPEEIMEVERLVNEAIKADMPISYIEMTVDEAKAQGAIGLFEERYGDKVRVYSMGDFSREICGGPHATSTGELKGFRIQKEESSSAGVRRIKATVGA